MHHLSTQQLVAQLPPVHLPRFAHQRFPSQLPLRDCPTAATATTALTPLLHPLSTHIVRWLAWVYGCCLLQGDVHPLLQVVLELAEVTRLAR